MNAFAHKLWILSLAAEQYTENIQKAVAEVEEAKAAWQHAKTDPKTQALLSDLRDAFVPQSFGGVTYEKRWESLKGFFDWLSVYIRPSKNPAQEVADACEALKKQIVDGELKMSADDIAICKVAKNMPGLPPEAKKLFQNFAEYGERQQCQKK